MGFEIDKKSIEAIKKKVTEDIRSGISPKTKKILSQAEGQMYLNGISWGKDEFEKNIITRFKLSQAEYEEKVKLPIEKFFVTLESKGIFLNSIKEACYLLEQLPESSQITKQHLIDLDAKVKAEGRGINNDQFQK